MIDVTQDSFILPHGWAWTKLGDVCSEPQYGWTTSSVAEGRTKLLRTTDITSGKINWADVPFCKEEPYELEKYLLKNGDIIITRAGSVGYSYLINNSPTEAIFASYLIRFKPLIHKQYLAYFLKSPSYWGAIKDNTLGIAIPNVNATKLKQIFVPLSPLAEQHRIVAKIEELFTKLDVGVDVLKKIKAQLKRYRQSVLKYAFEGKLTEEWRELHKDELEPASAFLEKIREERQKGAKGKYRESCLTDTSDFPGLPKEWCWVRLGEIAETIQIGPFGSQLHQEDYKENGIPIINPKHIKEQKIFPQEMISEDKAEQLSRYKLFTNDIVLGRRGEMGRAAPITFKEDGWLCGTGSLFIRLGDRFNSKLYSLILSEKMVVDYLEKSSIGTTMTNLNSMILINLPIQLIPTAEQQAIIEEIETCFSIVDALDETIEHSLKQSVRLRHSILKKAFEGKLVPQNPDDEPAEKLLERIKTEKTALPGSFIRQRSLKQKESI